MPEQNVPAGAAGVTHDDVKAPLFHRGRPPPVTARWSGLRRAGGTAGRLAGLAPGEAPLPELDPPAGARRVLAHFATRRRPVDPLLAHILGLPVHGLHALLACAAAVHGLHVGVGAVVAAVIPRAGPHARAAGWQGWWRRQWLPGLDLPALLPMALFIRVLAARV